MNRRLWTSAFALLLLPAWGQAATITVTNCNAAGAGSLPQAVADAVADDEIRFQAGLDCTGNDAITVTETLVIDRNLLIDGTGASIEVNGGWGGIFAPPSGVRVFMVEGNVTDVTLRRLTIRRGYAATGVGGGLYNTTTGDALRLEHVEFRSNGSASSGGALANRAVGGVSNPVLTNVVFRTNFASLSGGAIYNDAVNGGTANPSLSKVEFIDNVALENGGAIYNYASSTGNTASPTFVDAIFSGNVANEEGGAIYSRSTSGTHSPSFTDTSFINNDAGTSGGAISWLTTFGGTANPAFTNVTFHDNTAASAGGAIYVSVSSDGGESSPIFNNVRFTDNTANRGGMASIHTFHNATSTPVFENVVITGNSALAADGGGAIKAVAFPDTELTVRLINATLHDNTAATGPGGALFLSDDASAELTNSTLANNYASTTGGAIHATQATTATIHNSIIWGNTVGAGTPSAITGLGTVTVNHSIVEGGYAGTDNLDVDPLLLALADNGGFVETMALQDGSPAIGNGDPGECPATDARGVPRKTDCDRGAWEGGNFFVTVVPSGNGTGTVVSTPAGIDCPANDCTAPFAAASTTTLTATADAGSVFAGWAGACHGLGDCNLSALADNHTVYAIFNTQGVASLTPGMLDFGDVAVGEQSATQNVSVTNAGLIDLTIGGAFVVGDFVIASNDCPASLAPAADCSIGLRFAPAAAGTRNGALFLPTDAPDSPHSVVLTGEGTGAASGVQPAVTLNPTSIDFGSIAVGGQSTVQNVTLTNSGASDLAISSIVAVGDYQIVSDNCPASLAAAANCTIGLRFVPTAAGTRNGVLFVSSDAPGQPHSVVLTGTGTAAGAAPQPAVALNPTNVDFGSVTVGSQSATHNVTLTNGGAAALSIGSVLAVGDYVITGNDCGTSLAASASCTIGLRFAPVAAGPRSGALFLSSNAAGSPHNAALMGTGVNASQTPTNPPSDPPPNPGSNPGGGGSDAASGGLSVSGGCSLGGNGSTDPLWPLLIAAGLGWVWRRRRGNRGDIEA